MRRLLLVVLGSVLLAGCAESPDPDPALPPASPVGAPETVDADEVPAATRAAYLDALTAIDPGLTRNADRAIRRATNICLDISQGKDEQTVVGNAAQRLSSGDATIDEEQAARVVELTRTHICGSA